ncbi:MAG: polyprenyl synthetase family protein [Candidatus Moranbacteria bacterium]|jgi:geranylgeranyl diphosphate synthase type I|nr:polyprenyl synthetase family protein [Candidatus Moranbacteria bacterium]MBP9801444.1 polyprenyl synthetase family protein [Candidatus Moranbacteria bacterium]
MDVQILLRDFKARFDPKISAYFDTVEANAKEEDLLITEALRHVRNLTLSGGKRLRPACMFYGYLAGGGTDEEAILETAVSIELLHTFLLVHDDIIDRDDFRHGKPTLHRQYAEFGRKYFPDRDVEHFGNSIALIVGDLLSAMSNDIIFRAPFPQERIFEALSRLQSVVSYTVIGQAQDIYMEYKRDATEEEILKMYKNKTARYTMERPIQMGLLLAGDEGPLVDTLSGYALPLGIAFQIQDDILGVFGSELKIGKPVGSDIQEGKLTLLVAYALEQGTHEQQQELRRILSLGTGVTLEDIERFRNLLVETKSLVRAQEVARHYIQDGKQVLEGVRGILPPRSFDFFEAIADYMAEREY